MGKHLLRTLFIALMVVMGGNVWAAGYTRTLTNETAMPGYVFKAFYDFQNNDPAVLPTSGDLRYREGGVWGLHNFGSGTRSGTATIPVAEGDIIVVEHYNTTYATINCGALNESLSSTAGYQVYDITSAADEITFTVGRYGGLIAVLVMEKDASVTTVDYTINYLLNGAGEPLKTSTGNIAVGASVTTDASFFVDAVKYIRADGEPASVTVTAETTTFSIKVREAQTFNYSLNSSLGATLSQGSDYEGETVYAPYPLYQLQDNVLYEAAATNKEYRKAFTLTEDNQTATVDYTAKEDINAVFFTEAESLADVTPVTTSNIPVRASNALAAVAEGTVAITTLAPGKYKFHVGIFTSKSNYDGFAVKFGIGEETLSATFANVNLCEFASDEFELNAETAITFMGAESTADAQFDYIWIEKTGDVVVVDPNDYTSYIVNADLKGEGGFDATGTKGIDGSGIVKAANNAQFDFNQTITLPAGQYKVTAQAAYRYSGSEADEYAAIVAEQGTKLAALYATVNGKTVSSPVANRYDGASSTDYAGGDGSVIVNELYVPNSSKAVQAWFNAGQYVNELVFNVPAEGEVTIGIVKTAKPDAGDYTVIGPWTLTRLGDAEVEVDEPLEMTDMIVNPSFEDGTNGWTYEPSNDHGAKDNSNGTYTMTNCDGAHMFNIWSSGNAISQTVTGLPNGNYKLTAVIATDAGQKVQLNANDKSAKIDASAEGKGVGVEGAVEFLVTDGTATIGAEGVNKYWYKVDNFRLFFLSELTLDDLLAEVTSLRSKLTDIKAEVEVAKVVSNIEDALAATESVATADDANAAIAQLNAVLSQAEASVAAKKALTNMQEVVETTNVYTAAAYQEYYGQWADKYEAGTITLDEARGLQDPSIVTGWHAAITVDNFLLSAWDTNPDFVDAPYYINTWSVEGDNDGSDFHVPFFEYWTGDDNSLAERTLTATMNDVEPGNYEVYAWVRVRAKNGYTAPAYGITMSANDGEAVPVIGDQIGDSQFYLDNFSAFATVGADGVLKIQFNIAADNNISWLSFKNVGFYAAISEDPEIEVPEGKINLIANGNLASDDVTSFVSKEYPSSEIVGAAIVAGAGKNGSRGIVVKSADETTNESAQGWDTQFWIKVSEPLPSGTKLHVEFDYAASQSASASTQAHAAPGAYQHWAAIGNVNFTTEWQHFSADITVDDAMAKGDNGNGSGTGMMSIAFNLADEKSATEYYFDNFGVWAEMPKPIDAWTDIVVNGSMEGDDMSCFYVTEQGIGGPYLAYAFDGIGVDGSKAVRVQSADGPANDWDTQFFIRLPYELPAGTKFKLSFDYKADVAGGCDTQAHNEPGEYIHWACAGSPSFTTEWQSYAYEGTVPAECNGTEDTNSHIMKNFQTIAFNLAKNKVATNFVIDNVKFEVPANVAETLTPSTAENTDPYRVGIDQLVVDTENAAIFDLTGRRVNNVLKGGLYLINGKKVFVK